MCPLYSETTRGSEGRWHAYLCRSRVAEVLSSRWLVVEGRKWFLSLFVSRQSCRVLSLSESQCDVVTISSFYLFTTPFTISRNYWWYCNIVLLFIVTPVRENDQWWRTPLFIDFSGSCSPQSDFPGNSFSVCYQNNQTLKHMDFCSLICLLHSGSNYCKFYEQHSSHMTF